MGLEKRVGLLKMMLAGLIVLSRVGGGLGWLGVSKMEWMRLRLPRAIGERNSGRKLKSSPRKPGHAGA